MTEHETPTADERAIHWCESRGANLTTLALHERGQCCSECASVAAAIRDAEAAEREVCAKVAQAEYERQDRLADYACAEDIGCYMDARDAADNIAKAIRTRGTP